MLRRASWILLVPAIALAAPRGHHKGRGTARTAPKTTPKTTTPAEPATTEPAAGSAAGSGSDATSTSAATTPAATPPPTAPAMPAAGTGSAAPAPETTEPPAAKDDVDVDSLRQEYLSLRDELFKSRARANAVASQLYSTRITLRFTWTSARYYGVTKASVRLDGATVYEDTTGAIGNDDGVRFDGYVAPGRHLVTFHVDASGKDDDSFTSSTESQIVVKATAGKDLLVAAKGKDSGDIAYQWKRSEHGSYGLGIDVAVKTVAQAGAKK
ncbi:MAG TPA: hypothetical protein VFS15_12120 [Kofleriaceae bacterium]|nr:hypothetical protein [Kofleriaceae bacterium]